MAKQPASLHSPEYVYGAIDFGGTKTVIALVRGDGAVIRRQRWDTPSRPSPEATIERWASAWSALSAGEEVVAVGVAAPGPSDAKTGVLHQVFDWDWRDVPLAAEWQRRIGLPVRLDNDVNCCCLAERCFGAGRQVDDLLWVQVSTGVGGALWMGGKAYGGANGLAGEIGHMVMEENGPLCACGRRGCLQALVSGPAIARRWAEAAAAGAATPSASAEEVFAAEAAGDPRATAVIRTVAEDLGRGLSLAVNLLDPALVVLGGGVMVALARHIAVVERAMRARVIGASARTVRVVPSAVGYDAALLGAAALAGAGGAGRRSGD